MSKGRVALPHFTASASMRTVYFTVYRDENSRSRKNQWHREPILFSNFRYQQNAQEPPRLNGIQEVVSSILTGSTNQINHLEFAATNYFRQLTAGLTAYLNRSRASL